MCMKVLLAISSVCNDGQKEKAKTVNPSWCCLVESDSFVTLWTVAHQSPLSLGFPRQEYWSGLPFPSPGDLSNPETKLESPALTGRFFTTEPPGKPIPESVKEACNLYICMSRIHGLPGGSLVKNSPANTGVLGLVPGPGSSWRRKRQPILSLLPGKSHGQRRLGGHSPRGH